MAGTFDDQLFFSRRLGFGLKRDETIEDIREWAVSQISEVPLLDFYGPDGTSILSALPDFAVPWTTVKEASEAWGRLTAREDELIDKADSMDPDEWDRAMEEEVNLPRADYPAWRDCLVHSLSAVNGPSPVFERFWMFWVNHFTVGANGLSQPYFGPHTRLIRDNMTGKFADLLKNAILNPAMIYYLDNFLSSGPNSQTGLDGYETINENLARELLELHTVSPAGGYTQDDVVQTAYALTGWALTSGKKNKDRALRKFEAGVVFDIRRHEPGSRTIMGKTYGKEKKGANQAPQLMADLAVHPATAHFIAWKLIRHFVADEPPAESVAHVRDVWLETGGDLVAVHTAVIDEVLARGREFQKFTTPEVWLLQMHRMIGAPISIDPGSREPSINFICEELGHGWDRCAQPNGWSDLGADWTSRELLERRLRYAYTAVNKSDRKSRQFILDCAKSMAGDDSPLSKAVAIYSSAPDRAMLLVTSPEFLRI